MNTTHIELRRKLLRCLAEYMMFRSRLFDAVFKGHVIHTLWTTLDERLADTGYIIRVTSYPTFTEPFKIWRSHRTAGAGYSLTMEPEFIVVAVRSYYITHKNVPEWCLDYVDKKGEIPAILSTDPCLLMPTNGRKMRRLK